MRITMLGTGTSMPDSTRVQSGALVETQSQRVLVDIGSGVLHRLAQIDFNFTSLDAVFITHFHVDHCSDFMTLLQTLWMSGFDKALSVYGPPMIEDWLQALRDSAFPYLAAKIELRVHPLSIGETVVSGDLKVTNTETLHGTMDTRALRIEDDDSVALFSSDTAPSQRVIDLARGADILIHECNWLDGPHPEGVHTSPGELARIVQEVAPRLLALTHVSPEVVADRDSVLQQISAETDARVVMSEDLMQL